jgi:hypothetical protein
MHSIALPVSDGEGLIATILPVGEGRRSSLMAPWSARWAVFSQNPTSVPQIPGEAFARLYGPDRTRIARCARGSAGIGYSGSSRTSRPRQGNSQKAPSASLRKDRNQKTGRVGQIADGFFAAHARIGAARADNPRAVESGRLVRSFRRQPSVETGGWPEVVLLFGLGPFSIPRSGDACSGVVR